MVVHAVIDASNLHVGGGVQVASSFISEILTERFNEEFPWLDDTRILVSPEVQANLHTDTRLMTHVPGPTRKRASIPGLTTNTVWFDIFGGAFQRSTKCVEIAGFADVTSIYRIPFASRMQSLKRRARAMVSLARFKRPQHLIVEAAHVADRLVEHGFDRNRISIVPNTYHGIFEEVPDEDAVAKWRSEFATQTGRVPKTFLYVARAYPHKNHNFLGEVGDELLRRGHSEMRFVVTLTDEEWARSSPKLRRFAINVGPQNIQHLPALYAAVDGVVFPSLLECFSATPLEAIRMGKPLIAGDQPFVKSVIHENAVYPSPDSVQEWADAIYGVVSNGVDSARLDLAKAFAKDHPGSRQRARRYLEIIGQHHQPCGTH